MGNIWSRLFSYTYINHVFNIFHFQYTPEEIKWYGYSLSQAVNILKQQLETEEQAKIVPLKHIYRAELVNQLKAQAASESEQVKIEYVAHS